MAKKGPEDVPRSPTGRVPQWALDEATGRTVDPVPFRGATAPSVHAPSRARRRRRVWIGWVLVALAIAVIAGLVAWTLVRR